MALLPKKNPEVQQVLSALKDRGGLASALEGSPVRLGMLIASETGAQLEAEAIQPYEERAAQGDLDALIFQTAPSGSIVAAAPYDGAVRLMSSVSHTDVAVFLIPDSPEPLKAPRRNQLESLGALVLQNAFTGDIGETIAVVHRAFRETGDRNVAASAVYYFYEQNQFPPEGWFYQPAKLVRAF